jgi:hypothetical protein
MQSEVAPFHGGELTGRPGGSPSSNGSDRRGDSEEIIESDGLLGRLYQRVVAL